MLQIEKHYSVIDENDEWVNVLEGTLNGRKFRVFVRPDDFIDSEEKRDSAVSKILRMEEKASRFRALRAAMLEGKSN